MKQIRESKFSKIVVYYLMIMMFLQVTQPVQMYALTSGPTQPEFNSFTPISTSDMVDLTSGDFNYNIPIMDVGGYPINLSYDSGITMDEEASWVGLGWNMNVGQIERQVRGLPDDFNGDGEDGDVVEYDNDMKENRTVGMNLGVNAAVLGFDSMKVNYGLSVENNNYEGISFRPSFGVNFTLSDNVSVGMNFSSSIDGGATVSPSVSLSSNSDNKKENCINSLSSTASLGLNSRKGIENLNISASGSQKGIACIKGKEQKFKGTYGGVGGSISFNDQSFTPSKRVGYDNKNFSFNGALGGELWGIEPQVQVMGYGSYQNIHKDYKHRPERAYGYENTQYKGSKSGILDFNREKERAVNSNTTSLPVTNYTYDLYNIQGQGVSGMFRPYRSKVGNVSSDLVTDWGSGTNFGVEVGLGNLAHGSGDFKTAPSKTQTGPWSGGNTVLPYLAESNTDAHALDYEPYAFKMVGSMSVDPVTNDVVQKHKALRIGIQGKSKNSSTTANYYSNVSAENFPITKMERAKRYVRSQVVQKVSNKEANNDPLIQKNGNAKPHHTAGIKVLKTDGSTYVYGTSAYSTKKIEATFDVSNKKGDNTKGLVTYDVDGNGKISGNNTPYSDRFLNKITTPQYAHSFMLSSVLSADYEDVDNNGPTMNDLGTYTKFEYKTVSNYKWRVPFGNKEATYNEGLISHKHDQKGNYIYGEKELVYLDRIVTKTHVAFFDLEDRKDAIGVAGETGGAGSGRMKKIKSIRLYSRPEATDNNGNIVDPQLTGSSVKPIKTAHFIYSYNLCKGVPNNSGGNITPNELSNAGGKLTLEKVYFTYRGSNMGKYTPYVFNYGNDDLINNPAYNAKGFDIWGNFKENPAGSGNSANDASPLSNTEFPYVDQKNRTTADNNVQAWGLKTIKLPSGGQINIETESDDYRYVQNKKAMQMFKVIGAGSTPDPSDNDVNKKKLYEGNDHKKYLYVKLDDSDIISTVGNEEQRRQWFIDNYLKENYSKPIQYKFLLNMRDDDQYDYVPGYFQIKENLISTTLEPTIIKINVQYNAGHGTIAAIPLAFLKRDGGTNGNAKVNPIAKGGWSFGRTHLNRIVYGLEDDPTNSDFKSIIKKLEGSLGAIKEIFTGPNKALQTKGCAMNFKEKSWIRLENPNGRKLGGGSRVKSIQLSDNWSTMFSNSGGTNVDDMAYKQTFSYTDDNGKSTGVATFEPNASPENPFVEPVYPNSGSYAETISAPKESNYVEKPFGENFFPAPKVTYSRVTVKNDNQPAESGTIIKKHATGKIVTEHYTSYDFPTQVEHTKLDMINDLVPNSVIGGLIRLGNIKIRNHLTMSQGFSIETNDMDGKIKKETVYDEGNSKISSVEYKYSVDSKGQLDNYVTTIDPKGNVEKKAIGVDYDMINDFNESYSATKMQGFDANVAAFMIGLAPAFIPTVIPKKTFNENQLRTVVTTKHTHKIGIMIEKIATDLGASVSTKNLAWDAGSGDVILTGTANEYGDPYYSFSYPAYWMYQGMGPAADNLDIQGVLKRVNECDFDPRPYFKVMNPQSANNTLADLSAYFHPGDELMLEDITNQDAIKVWVLGLSGDKKGLLLMDREGNYLDNCGENVKTYRFKIVRSGYRNLQSAMMASVTSMIYPLKNNDADPEPDIFDQNSFIYNGTSGVNPRIINASAVVYKDFWKPQRGEMPHWYPRLPGATSDEASGEVSHPYNVGYNPYVWNTKGDWKAEKSYAYLGGRKSGNGSRNNPRNEGFFTNFTPFYQLTGTTQKTWAITDVNWTGASSITQFSPFGMELENKDALGRHSAAQYGYQNKLPMAVASNSKYNEIGFEGFEETQNNPKKHFVFNGIIGGNQIPVTISNTEWHTGKRSVKVTKTAPVKMVRKLKPEVVTAQLRNCNYNCSQVVEIVRVSSDIPHHCVSFLGQGYTKYKLSAKCVDLKVSGVDGQTSVGSYKFTEVPGEPNNVYVTFYGYLNLDYLDPNNIANRSKLIPVVIEGENINLLYVYSTREPYSENPNCFTEGELKCP